MTPAIRAALASRCTSVSTALATRPCMRAADAVDAVRALLSGAADAPSVHDLDWYSIDCGLAGAGLVTEAAGWLAHAAATLDRPREVEFSLDQVDWCLAEIERIDAQEAA